MTRAWRNLLESLPGLVAVATLPAGILAAILVGGDAAGIVFVVGWLLLTPLTAILVGDVFELEEGSAKPTEDPLETLRERYASGEIDEVEFERRLEVLLDTEDLDGDRTEDVERALEAVRER